MKIYPLKLDDDVHHALRIKAAERGITVLALLTEAINHILNRK